VWFLWLGIALVLLTVGGLYVRRRVLAALETLGVRRKPRRIVGWVIPWLLYGYPIIVFAVIAVSLALGRESFRTAPSGVLEWVLVYPFWMALLVTLQALPFVLVFDAAGFFARRRIDGDRLRRYRAVATMVVIAFFAVYTPARILLERGRLDVHHYDVGSGDPDHRFRIAFIADLQQDHHTDEARADQVIELINSRRPDIVIGGGDWIASGPDYIEAAARSAGKLRSRLGTFTVEGDHEHFAYADPARSKSEVVAALARHGVTTVNNQVRWIEYRGKRIAVAYLSYNYIYRSSEADIRALIDRTRGADYSILVSHQLDRRLARLIEGRVDLALIAHTHGGQVNPVLGFFHANIARVETPYVAGRYQLGQRTTIIVTSGIGYSIAPFRYASPASVEIIDLHL
jgi:predicted MPP superfamily phosphohydrolase